MYSQYKGKKVYLLLADDTYLYGRLENYDDKLYQVTSVESIVTFFAEDIASTTEDKIGNIYFMHNSALKNL